MQQKIKIKVYVKGYLYVWTWDPGISAIHTKDQISFSLISVKSRVCLYWETKVDTVQWHLVRMKLDVQ